MSRALLDANAVLRYLLEDDEAKAGLAEKAIAEGAEATIEVIAECVYVLEGVYGVPHGRVNESLLILLGEVSCERMDAARSALSFYSASRLDFVDCVLMAEHVLRGSEIVTFDKKLVATMTRADKAMA